LSQTLKGLEEKVGVRLLSRTTRSVSLTPAGQQLLRDVGQVFESLEGALDGLAVFRDGLAGHLRILSSRTAATLMVGPLIGAFLDAYPEIRVEMLVDDLNIDLVEERIDAGIQVRGRIDKDMITQLLVPSFSETLFAAPDYLHRRGIPKSPTDLSDHRCVRLRSAYDGVIQPWALTNGEQKRKPNVGIHFVANDLRVLASAVASGAGIGLLPPVLVRERVKDGALQQVLPGWSSPVPGIYLYYPSRSQIPHALAAFIAFMGEHRPPAGWAHGFAGP
jgi:DNA-binding transcriptional LysR family regulator